MHESAKHFADTDDTCTTAYTPVSVYIGTTASGIVWRCYLRPRESPTEFRLRAGKMIDAFNALAARQS